MVDTSTEAVTKLLDGVTSGPWSVDEGESYCDVVTDCGVSGEGFVICEYAYQNASFIAAARDMVPALLAERDALRAKLDAAVDASEKMITVRNRYDATPSDRGGAWGPKGRANYNWRIAFADLAATIAKIKGADK